MHSKKRRRLFGALTLGVALVGGLRGWIRGVQETLPGDRTEGLTVKIAGYRHGHNPPIKWRRWWATTSFDCSPTSR